VSKILLACAFVGGVVTAAGGWYAYAEREPPPRSATELMDVLMWNREPVGGPFALIDHNGRLRTDSDFRGSLMLVYFGFTFCSDICPIDLQSIADALDKLGPAAEAVQPLFITVDPEKDTPEQLKNHVALFHPRMIGLTGTPRQIRQVANSYKVYYARTEPTRRGDPNLDHIGNTFLVDRDGRYLGFFPPGTSADRLTDVIRPLIERAPRS
jgi:protein SCO1